MTLYQRLVLRWPLIMAAVFSAFTLILLWGLYTSQERLRIATDARLVADSQRRAAAVSDFVAERQEAALELAGSHEIESYVVNRALGMSPQYGLNVALDAIEQRFRQQIEQKTLRGQPVYTRIVFVGEDGAVLAEAGKDEQGAAMLRIADHAPHLRTDAKTSRIVASAPVVHRGVYSGTVVTLSDLRLLSRLLIAGGEAADSVGKYQEFLLTDQGTSIPAPGQPAALTGDVGRAFSVLPENRLTAAAEVIDAEAFRNLLALRTSIPGAQLSMLTLTSKTDAYGQLSSPAYVLFLGAFAAALLVAAFGFERMRKRAVQLQDDYAVSDHHRAELEQRNQALSAEISRRETVEAALYEKTEELNRSNAELRTSRERLDFALRGANDGIWDWNMLANEHYVSERWRELLGYGKDELPPGFAGWADLIHPDDRERTADRLRRHLEQREPFAAEFRMLMKSGEYGWFLSRGQALWNEQGQAVRMAGSLTDITERKRAETERAQLEAQLRESQKMEALGTLAGGVAHDFNNIVATIMGNAELALRDVGPEHAAQESLEEIRKASRRAKDLVQQILAFGRRQVLERHVMSLAPAVEETVRLLRSMLPAGVSLSIACAQDAPVVLADATQIQQVLFNLCANAWQAMQAQEQPAAIEVGLALHVANGTPYSGQERRSKGGRVALRPGRYACLTVRDTGPGMDQATRSRIFEPFFTTKPVGKGTGLGLAVVHGIVQDHGASIAVHSAPGEGATFRIYFPESQQTAAAAPPGQAAPGAAPEAKGASLALQGEGKRILYLDDDEAIVFLMTRLLEREGYRVTGYTDPHEALAAVRAQPQAYDLVVTDYNMPGMSGLEVARALREIRAGLPVALASGYITEELRAQAPAAGVSELIYKPNTVDELCVAVARLATAQGGLISKG